MPEDTGVFSSDFLVEALVRTGELRSRQLSAALAVANHPQIKLGATLLSCWLAEGRLDPQHPHAQAIQRSRRRSDRLNGVRAQILRAVPSAVTLKGAALAGRYPPGILREQHDLDLAVDTADDLWRACHALGEGWEPTGFLWVDSKPPKFAVTLDHPVEDELTERRLRVELLTVGLIGNGWGVPSTSTPRLRELPPEARDLAMLLQEGLERPYGVRDALDATTLLSSWRQPAARAVARDVVRETGMGPEAGRLAALLDVCGRHEEADRLGAIRGAPFPLSRARRARRVLAAGLRPSWVAVGMAQQAARPGGGGLPTPIVRALSPGLRRWVLRPSVARAAGRPLFGALVAERPSDQGLTVREHGRILVAETPIGRFALVAGTELREDDIADLQDQ